MEKFYFVMPAYNESDNIEDTVKQWYPVIEKINAKSDCEAILAIANDGSKDDTYNKLITMKLNGGGMSSSNLSTNLTAVMDKRCCICIAMPSRMVRTISFRQTPMVKLIRRSSGRCLNTATTTTFK